MTVHVLQLFQPDAFQGKFAAMKIAPTYRSLTAWTLYFCVLFNVFACGLGHGQMLGFELNGIGGQFCSVDGNDGPLKSAGGAPSSGSVTSTFNCPVCSGAIVVLALLFCLSWLLRLVRPTRFRPTVRSKAPPRYVWPSANPRASPGVYAVQSLAF